NGELVCIVAEGKEISERPSLEAGARDGQESVPWDPRALVLSVVAHDLRNPLSNVKMAAQRTLQALDSGETDEARAAMAIASRAVVRMERLIDDLLLANKVQAGHLLVRPEVTCIERLVTEALEGAELLRGQQAIVRELAPELPPVL